MVNLDWIKEKFCVVKKINQICDFFFLRHIKHFDDEKIYNLLKLSVYFGFYMLTIVETDQRFKIVKTFHCVIQATRVVDQCLVISFVLQASEVGNLLTVQGSEISQLVENLWSHSPATSYCLLYSGTLITSPQKMEHLRFRNLLSDGPSFSTKLILDYIRFYVKIESSHFIVSLG